MGNIKTDTRLLDYSDFYQIVLNNKIKRAACHIYTKIDGIYYFYYTDWGELFKSRGFWGKSPSLKRIDIKELEEHIGLVSRRDKILKIKERISNG